MAHRAVRLATAVCLACAPCLAARPAPTPLSAPVVAMDGRFDEWSADLLLHTDAQGDAGSGALDFGRLWAAHTDEHLFLCVEVGAEANLQEPGVLSLLLDTDADSSTGRQMDGLGVDLLWPFGAESGTVYVGGTETPVTHGQIGLVTAPTVTSTTFEIRLGRSARTPQGAPLFPGRRLRLALRAGPEGDRLPDGAGFVTWSLDIPPVRLPDAIPLARADSVDLRVAAFNTWRGGPLDAERAPRFGRLLGAVRPDVLGLEEMEAGTAERAGAWLGQVLGRTYHHAQVADNVLLSRYPVVQVQEIGANGAFVVDPRPELPRRMLFVVAHPPCCRRDAERQRELDQIAAFLGQARQPDGPVAVDPGSPVFVMGDMNLVGPARQLRTLQEGAIVDQATFGPAAAPDWDGTPLADLCPLHTHAPFAFTWCRDSERFTPGRLDFLFYADSAVRAVGGFVVSTPEMPDQVLQACGLERDDSPSASDHLPVVGDFMLRAR